MAACSSGGGPSTSASTGITQSAQPSSAPSLDSAVDGGYVRGEQQLVLAGTTFHGTIATGLTADGTFSASGSTLTFRGGGICTGSGTYTWRRAGQRLTLTEVSESCSLRQAALAGTWTPIRSLADAVPGHFAVLSDGRSIAMYRGDAEAPESGPLVVEMRTTKLGASFEPTVIRGRPGRHVLLSLVNVDPNERHTFTIAQQGIDIYMPPNDRTPVPVTVTIPQAGTLTFVCTYHVAVYMLGELEAE
jgi:plastocyanin